MMNINYLDKIKVENQCIIQLKKYNKQLNLLQD